MIYLLDTSICISFYERYYPKENFPSFWKKITPILNKQVLLLDVVVAENKHSDWFTKEYLTKYFEGKIIKSAIYSDAWKSLLRHIEESPYYSEIALSTDNSKTWAKLECADGWLIAVAKEEGYTIVTDETKNPSLKKGKPTKECKIPDIAEALEVRCIDRLQFFKEVGLRV